MVERWMMMMRRLGDLKMTPVRAVRVSQTVIASVEIGHSVALSVVIVQTVLAALWPRSHHNHFPQLLVCPRVGAFSDLPCRRTMMIKPDRCRAPRTGQTVEFSRRLYYLKKNRAFATLVRKVEFRPDRDRVLSFASRRMSQSATQLEGHRLSTR